MQSTGVYFTYPTKGIEQGRLAHARKATLLSSGAAKRTHLRLSVRQLRHLLFPEGQGEGVRGVATPLIMAASGGRA